VAVSDLPVTVFNFTVRLIETAKPASALISAISAPVAGGFSECTGLEASMQIEEWREGGRNDAVLRFPGHVTHPNIRLRRGVTVTNDLFEWHEAYLRGRGRRRDGVIELHDDLGNTVRTWRFRRGLPARWAGPTMNATQNAVAIEELEIAHEGLFVQAGGLLGDVAQTVGSVVQALGGL
jgi:phage tail-like protein